MALAIKPYTDAQDDWYEVLQFNADSFSIDEGYVEFVCDLSKQKTTWSFSLGDFYKIKIAYCDGNGT
jgi:hypothetical protein